MVAAAAVNQTCGVQFVILSPCTITGIKFYTAVGGGHTMRCRLWDHTHVSIATVDVACGGPGTFTGTFGAAVTITAADMQFQHAYDAWYTASVWETTGNWHTRSTQPLAWNKSGIVCGHSYMAGLCRMFGGGDVYPGANNGDRYPVDPIVQPTEYSLPAWYVQNDTVTADDDKDVDWFWVLDGPTKIARQPYTPG